MPGRRSLRAQKQQDSQKGQKTSLPAATDALRNTEGGPSNRPPAGQDGPPQLGPNGAGQSRGGMGWISRLILFILLLFVAYNGYVYFANNSTGQQTLTLPYSEFQDQVHASNVASVTITDHQTITGTLKTPITYDNVKATTFTTVYPYTDDAALQNMLGNSTAVVTGKYSSGNDLVVAILFNVVPILLLVLIFLWISRRATQSQQNIFNFGRSRAKLIMEDRPSTTFADIAGVDEAKAELEEVVEFLKTPQKFQRLGGKIPRGVLLVGPPGTGKTLLARAVAGEAGVPFFSMSGSEFVEVLVGVGASRVRDLFDQAKKASPSIIFIDEIDAVGRQRGSSINTNDEREQTLNQLLVEMDGFDNRQAVVVIAATNRPDGLDVALLRPGRFDRRVTVDRPDWNGRLAILMIHTRGVPLAPDVDLVALARSTTGMVGADLANLVNEAALLAARRNMDRVNQQCFLEALDKILLGAERPLVLGEEDLNVVAYHEGGHALAGLLAEDGDPITKVTIVPRGQALGVTMSTPLDDRYNYSKEYLLSQIVYGLGGRAAEQVAIGHITTGAENDLQRVTMMARQMVTRWGMSERMGTISFSEREDPFAGTALANGSREYSEKTATIIDEEVNRIVRACYSQTIDLIESHHSTLDRIAQELRRQETIDADQLQAILRETGVTAPAHPKTPKSAPLTIAPEVPSESLP